MIAVSDPYTLLVRASLAVLGPRRRSGRQRPAETIAPFPMSRRALWALMIAVVGVMVSLPVLASWQGHLAQHGSDSPQRVFRRRLLPPRAGGAGRAGASDLGEPRLERADRPNAAAVLDVSGKLRWPHCPLRRPHGAELTSALFRNRVLADPYFLRGRREPSSRGRAPTPLAKPCVRGNASGSTLASANSCVHSSRRNVIL